MREISQLAPVLKEEEGLITIETGTRRRLQKHATMLGHAIKNDTNDLKTAFQEKFQQEYCTAAERLEHGLCE
eukprot:4218068-Ditylum_brightwellii.AAC.1